MKRLLSIGSIGALILFIATTLAYAQADKETLSRKEAQDVAVDGNQYVIGAEDVLYIHVWKEDSLTRTVPVRMDGKISLPLIQEIKAAGLTPLQLKEVLTRKFKEFIENPIVSVTVLEENSCKVYVTGLVKNPGVYRLRSETTVVQVISLAGGLTDWANPKKILVVRKEDGREKRITVNYKKIMGGSNTSSNVVLKAGDTVIVP
ncbi:MAG TPA: polysaccharide biosynthesis/export family protein [Thermodesulfobacteriota bacterium]|nr:polysaccharide biosynthesis/export family protein [Thermodesulfobacteriota bacterium]